MFFYCFVFTVHAFTRIFLSLFSHFGLWSL
jgi:hypothetical protein